MWIGISTLLPCARRRKVRLSPFPPGGENCARSLARPLPTRPADAGLLWGPLPSPRGEGGSAGRMRGFLPLYPRRLLCVLPGLADDVLDRLRLGLGLLDLHLLPLHLHLYLHHLLLLELLPLQLFF